MAHTPLRFSAHALRRMELRGITREEVGAVLERDEGVLQGSTGRWAHEATVGGRWITVIRRRNGTVHTVAPGRGTGEERLLWRP
ncbi:MAG: DUF4258 domain-containing protein [Thermoleophilia bacterium]|nr:DUF4258 domain-containing protein [Thermoleophilia bacterium]